MNQSTFISRGMYFEEFEIGQRIVSPGRTVTEADVVNFAGISGDFNSIHTDAVYAESTPFGQRVVYGLLGMSIASGLAVRTGVLQGTVIAFREIDNWKFSQPLFIGDTIHVEIEVEGNKLIPRLGGGMLTLGLKIKNQDDQTVMKGQWIVLVESKTEKE
jgi:3-hydroxybutyryl-CoA dehydratase